MTVPSIDAAELPEREWRDHRYPQRIGNMAKHHALYDDVFAGEVRPRKVDGTGGRGVGGGKEEGGGGGKEEGGVASCTRGGPQMLMCVPYIALFSVAALASDEESDDRLRR